MRIPQALPLITVFCLTTHAAHAADLSEQEQLIPKAPEVYVDTSQWGGFYLGAYGSYNWFKPSVAGIGDAKDEAAGFGGYAGFNWQFENQAVAGLEATAGLSDAQTSQGGVSVNQEWDASLRARLGYAYERSLIYSFAGLAISGVEANTITGSDDTTQTGYTFGGGIETQLFDNVTGRVEYGFSDYSSKGFELGAPGSTEVDLQTQDVKLGLGFKF